LELDKQISSKACPTNQGCIYSQRFQDCNRAAQLPISRANNPKIRVLHRGVVTEAEEHTPQISN